MQRPTFFQVKILRHTVLIKTKKSANLEFLLDKALNTQLPCPQLWKWEGGHKMESASANDHRDTVEFQCRAHAHLRPLATIYQVQNPK